MRVLRRVAVFLLITFAAVGGGGYFYLQREWKSLNTPPPMTIVEIPSGLGAQGVIELLKNRQVLTNENAALAYLFVTGDRSRLRAGEYLFDKPMTIPDIVGKLTRGDIYLHRFTVAEGLTVEQTALKWQEQGFGDSTEFLSAAKNGVDLVHDLDAKAQSLEGYLFPETYFFPKRTTSRQALEAMTGRFRHVLEKLKQTTPETQWPGGLRDMLILASLVESEAAVDDERPQIASVYLNRLRKKTLLQCDPTVIYALEQRGQYQGRLVRADLQVDSPYNTYRYAGLPPGPITNPGLKSLEAAANPAVTSFLYFVRTDAGRHTFSATLAAHNAAVSKYRAMVRASQSKK